MATQDEIIDCLMLLQASYPDWQRTLATEEIQATYKAYIHLLSDLPTEPLHEATLEYIRTQKFFPKICELREMVSHIEERQRKEREQEQRQRITYTAVPPPPVSEEKKRELRELFSRKSPHALTADDYVLDPYTVEKRKAFLHEQLQQLQEQEKRGH